MPVQNIIKHFQAHVEVHIKNLCSKHEKWRISKEFSQLQLQRTPLRNSFHVIEYFKNIRSVPSTMHILKSSTSINPIICLPFNYIPVETAEV